MASLLKLSADDLALFQSLQDSCLLPSLSVPGSGELVEVFKAKKREENQKAMAPYADLLEDELVKMLKRRKTVIYDELLNSKSTSFTVDLFSWNTVGYHETLKEMNDRVSKMTWGQKYDHQLRQGDRKATIEANKWETTFGVEMAPAYGYGPDDCESPDWVFRPMKVDRIFRQSDLRMRLALKLGPNFFPSIRLDVVKDVMGDPKLHNGYTVFKKTLYVRYHPFGLNERDLKSLLAVAKKEKERFEKGERQLLGPAQYPVGHGALNILK